jgi:hypothetical protein
MVEPSWGAQRLNWTVVPENRSLPASMFPGTVLHLTRHAVTVKPADSHRLLLSQCLFCAAHTPAIGPTQSPIQWVPGLPWGNRAGQWSRSHSLFQVCDKNTDSYSFTAPNAFIVRRFLTSVYNSNLPIQNSCLITSTLPTSVYREHINMWMLETAFREADTNTLNKQSQVDVKH